tara:strand:+ start:919 stop:1530 length:612 start_codon:yes stop_codon:yes gene_type:complete
MSAGELMPCYGVIESEWTLVENQTANVLNSGQSDVLELGTPYWEVDIRVDCPDRSDFDEWSAFIRRRRGFDLSFTMWRHFRPLPSDGSILSDSGLTLTGISEVNSTVSFSGFGANKTAHQGDMLSHITAGSGYWLGEVSETTQANGSGVITVPVNPRPRPAHASAPLPRRIKSLGEFRLSDRPQFTERFRNYSLRFSARQVIR